MLLVLETLGPTERAVFVLREVFDLPYDEIAAAVDKTPAAVRQIAHRARQHVDARRPRVAVSDRDRAAVVEKFLLAATTGDLQGLLDVLAPDVVLITDGGGRKQAALKPIHGVEKVLRFLAGIGAKVGPTGAYALTVNGEPAIGLLLDGELEAVATMRIDGDRVTTSTWSATRTSSAASPRRSRALTRCRGGRAPVSITAESSAVETARRWRDVGSTSSTERVDRSAARVAGASTGSAGWRAVAAQPPGRWSSLSRPPA